MQPPVLWRIMVNSITKHAKVVIFSTVHQAADSRVFYKEACSLARAGYDVILFAQADRDGTTGGVRIWSLPRSPRRLERALRSLKLLPQLLREKGDIYHFHDPELLPSGLVLRALGRKVIYDAHEDLPKDILGKSYLAPWLRAMVSAIVDPLERWSAHRMSAVITTRDSTRRRLRGTAVLNNYPILEYVRRRRREGTGKQHARFVVYFGTITRPLGAREMLAAVNVVSGRLPLKLRLLGVFEDDALRAEMLDSPASTVVEYGGFVTMPEVYRNYPGALAGLVLYNHPNHMETAAHKLFECMAFGVPVIASDFPLWRKIVHDQSCGLVVNPLNVRQIAEAIIYLIEHPDEAKKMGERGKELAEGKYNWESESKKLLLLYERLLSKCPKHSSHARKS